MTYKTDGSVHYDGISNELNTIEILNQLGIYEQTISHLGGTKNKADAQTQTKKITIKRKNGIRNGSFDWVNTSSYNNIFEGFDEFYENVKTHRALDEKYRTVSVDLFRSQFNKLCNQALDNINSKQLEYLIIDVFQKQDDYDVVVNDVKSKSLYIFEATSHPAYQLIRCGYTPKLVNSRGAKTSRKIILYKNDDEVDTGLRMRITSNNGINAFLGLSKANSNSQIVIKLQQDKIQNLLQSVNPKIYSY